MGNVGAFSPEKSELSGDRQSIEAFDLARRLVALLGGPEHFQFDALRVQGTIVPGSTWTKVELTMYYRSLPAEEVRR